MNELDEKLKYQIERLLNYSLEKELIFEEDVIVSRNTLLAHFKLDSPCGEKVSPEGLPLATDILEKLLDLSFEKGLITDNTLTVRDLESAKIMGYLTPRQSEVIKAFKERYADSPEKATDYFYNLSKNTDYIQTARTDKNICWLSDTSVGRLEITINLSKPEKDPREIAAAKSSTQSSYPKCLLCAENAGYEGRINHPARQNHRLIPLTLGGERWFLQFSPYLYYGEHSIILNEKHTPMQISGKTFELLLEFLEMFPHYFIGSNADLPIVGGSILSHDHFQGGRHSFPMESAPNAMSFTHADFKGMEASVIKWPLSTIRLKGENKDVLIRAALLILDNWRGYSDEIAGIYAFSKENGEIVRHNTVTPIARRKDKGYELDIVLRNNRTTLEYPLGIFHPHDDVHHIKKENIGLIEVMGLAILPARLKEECAAIADILTEDAGEKTEIKKVTATMLEKHKEWIGLLTDKYGSSNSREEADGIIKREIGVKFARVLEDAGVYKLSMYDRFFGFMKGMGFC